MEKKFNKIYESYVSRYTRGGFLTGDLVKVRDDYKSSEGYKKLSPEYKAKLDDLLASDLNLRVSGIENKYNQETLIILVVNSLLLFHKRLLQVGMMDFINFRMTFSNPLMFTLIECPYLIVWLGLMEHKLIPIH